MEKCIMVKTEVQPNGDIFMFYVDENGSPVNNAITIDQEQLDQLQENYVLEELPTETTYNESGIQVAEDVQVHVQDQNEVDESNGTTETWLEEETEKLLIFYIDNKEAFHNSALKHSHLWSVACKTMIPGKQTNECEIKFRNLKRKYSLLLLDHLKNHSDPKLWPFYELCHQAFHDDSVIQDMIKTNMNEDRKAVTISTSFQQVNSKLADAKQFVIANNKNKAADVKVTRMLQLYWRYKKEGVNNYLWQKTVWEKIASQLGEDAEFWHKKFLNYKQHYIRALEKRRISGAQSIAWPYMALYDAIYSNDLQFKRKYGAPLPEVTKVPDPIAPAEWNDTEKTVLVKYYFDCLEEFQDPSIPNGFLWNEVGRLLDKKPEDCLKEYEQLKKEHINLYIGDNYDLRTRKPIAILFDNIISTEVEKIFAEPSREISAADISWETEKLDTMVQFLLDNIEMFKDPICHFVCWAAIAVKIDDTIQACKIQWNDLTTLYKGILKDKKDDPELQIDWRYIDIFDRIFDYGMDTKLLEGYEVKLKKESKPKTIVIKKEKTSPIAEEPLPDNLSDLEPEEFEDKTPGKRARGIGDLKQIKILEYYLKYKDKFGTTQRKKQQVWDALASDIGLSAEQCAHRFRNLKQVYMAYVQREIDKPDKPILWPYFALCKKAFGYRQIKNKLKQSHKDLGDIAEWTPREIKLLISYFGQNMQDSCAGDTKKYATFAKDINKSSVACRDKLLDLRKSYRKIMNMKGRNPECKVNWKYFKFFNEIYSKADTDGMTVESADDNDEGSAVKTDLQDDDLQCIIVVPEGEDITNSNNAQIIVNKVENKPIPRRPWTVKDKVEFLKLYLQYIKEQQGKLIDRRKMLQDIGEKINRTVTSCKKIFHCMKMRYKTYEDQNKHGFIKKSPLYSIMDKIIAKAPKFLRSPQTADNIVLKEQVIYTDVPMPLWALEQSLNYYLLHVEEFISPKYDKKYAWINLGKAVRVSPQKIFKKINYLKQFFNSDTNEVNGEKFEFADLLRKILEKELECRIAVDNIPEPMNTDQESEPEIWTDEEIEQLLHYYLFNLDKFKNPIYAPSYLWMDASNVVNKSALACSKKMTEIRSQYSAMVKENSDALTSWRFYELCQKIYGTGKKVPRE